MFIISDLVTLTHGMKSHKLTNLTLSLLVATSLVCWKPLQTVSTQSQTDWIQTPWHFDNIPERFVFLKVNFLKTTTTTVDDNKSMKNYPACKEFKAV